MKLYDVVFRASIRIAADSPEEAQFAAREVMLNAPVLIYCEEVDQCSYRKVFEPEPSADETRAVPVALSPEDQDDLGEII